MIDERQAIELARICARERQREWVETSVRAERTVMFDEDCWVIWTDTQSPETQWMAQETDSFLGYVVRASDGRCIGLKAPFGSQMFSE